MSCSSRKYTPRCEGGEVPTHGPDSQRMTSHPLLHLPQAVVMTPFPRKRSKYPTWRVHSSPEIVSKLDSSIVAKTIIEIY